MSDDINECFASLFSKTINDGVEVRTDPEPPMFVVGPR